MTSNSETFFGNTRWLATTLWDAIRENILDHPVALERHLCVHEATPFQLKPKHSVALSDLIRWDQWLDDLIEGSFPADGSAFHCAAHFTQRKTVDGFSCTIRDIEGLTNSDPHHEENGDLDEMAVRMTDVAQDLSIANLQAKLAWTGRFGREPIIDRGDLELFLWDGRIFWNNPDETHSFIAARYLAKKLGVEVALKPRSLHIVSVDETQLQRLLSDWELFAMHDIFDACSRSASAQRMPSLHECLRSAAVPHRWASLPRPHAGCVMWIGGTARMTTGTAESIERERKEGKTALFLPRHDPRAKRAAAFLRQANAFDLGAYLSNLLRMQRAKGSWTAALGGGE